MILRKIRLSTLILVVFVLFGLVRGDDKIEDGFTSLFNGKDLAGFEVVLNGGQKNEAVGPVIAEAGVITITGLPGGYLRTDKSYKNYVLRFQWKNYFVNNGGSGALLHITGGDNRRGWPNCVEVHGDTPHMHGLLSGLGSQGDFKAVVGASKRAHKLEDWNDMEIISNDGELISKLNGVQVCAGKSALTEGWIGWQIEGAKHQLKNIRIKVLK